MDTNSDTGDIPPTFSPFRLKALRNARGLTRADLATRAGLSAPTIVSYECGRCAPSSAALGRLAGALHVDVSALYVLHADPLDGWSAVRSVLPPMTDTDVAELAGVLHRIDARRTLGAAS